MELEDDDARRERDEMTLTLSISRDSRFAPLAGSRRLVNRSFEGSFAPNLNSQAVQGLVLTQCMSLWEVRLRLCYSFAQCH